MRACRRARRAEGWRDAALAGAIAAGAAVVHFAYWTRGFVLLDEGYVATIAAGLRHGARPYRDAVTYALPGAYDLLALAFRLGGESLRTSRALMVGITAASAALVYLLARVAMTRAPAVLAGALFVLLSVWAYPQWHVYTYSTPSVVALLGAAGLVARGGRAAPFAAGIALGLAALCKQTFGAAGLATLGAIVAADAAARAPGARHTAGAFGAIVLGFAVPLALCVATAARTGVLRDLVAQAVVAPLASARESPFVGLPPLRPLLGQDAGVRVHLIEYLPALLTELRLPAILESALYRDTALVDVALKALFYLPVVVVAVALATLAHDAWRARAARALWWARARGAAVLTATALALLLGLTRPRDWMHASFVHIGTALLAAWLASRRRRATGALALAAVLAAWPTLRLGAGLRARAPASLDLPRAGVSASPADAAVLHDVVRAVEDATRAREPILVLPYHPLVYFLSDRPPATRFLLVWPVEPLADRDAEIAAAVDRLGVRTIVHATASAPQLGTLRENAPVLVAALADRFRVVDVIGRDPWGLSFQILARRPSPLPGSIHLDDVLGAATALRRRGSDVETVPVTTVARSAVWPFERVLAIAPTPGGVTEVRLPITVPEDRRQLVIGFGMNPDRWVAAHPVAIRFTARLEGAATPLVDETRIPQARIADRRGVERRLALAPGPATLVLAVEAPAGTPADADLVGWGPLRLEP